MLPDQVDPLLVQVRAQEVAGADGGVAVLQEAVGALDGVRQPQQAGVVALQVALQEAGHGGLVREEGDEVEAPPEGQVDQGDGAVGGVHGAHDEQVGGQVERLPGVLQGDRLPAVLQEVVQLAEDPRHVGPVELVDQQQVAPGGVSLGPPGEALQGALHQIEGRPPAVEAGPEALHEVLVGVGGVELHHRDPLVAAGQEGGQAPGDVGLARPRGAVEEALPPVVEEAHDALQRVRGEQEALRQRLQRAGVRRGGGPAPAARTAGAGVAGAPGGHLRLLTGRWSPGRAPPGAAGGGPGARRGRGSASGPGAPPRTRRAGLRPG